MKLKYKQNKKINNNYSFKGYKRLSRVKYSTTFTENNNCNYIYFLKSIILIIITILNLIFLLFNKSSSNHFESIELKKNIEKYNYAEKFPNLKQSFKNAKDFLDKCIKGILINNQSIQLSRNPIATVIIPVYNCKYTILRAIRSIQNQNITDLEIILVNDYSTNKTLSIIEQFQKEDPRIKIINNKENMGTLYSRSIGVMAAKGKYIFNLDNDDMVLDKDVYYTITNYADKTGFDIIGFKGISSNYGPDILTNNIAECAYHHQIRDRVLVQPELGYYSLRPDENLTKFSFIDTYLWTKCIKTKIYQKALNKYGEEKYSRYMVMWEDVIATYIIYNTAETMKYIGKYGVLYINTRGSGSKKIVPKIRKNSYFLYLIDTVIEFGKDTFINRKILVAQMKSLLEKNYLKETINLNEYNKNLFISCLNKILNMKYISNDDKEIIRKKAVELNLIKND